MLITLTRFKIAVIIWVSEKKKQAKGLKMEIEYTIKTKILDKDKLVYVDVPLEHLENEDQTISAFIIDFMERYMFDHYCSCSFNESQNHCDCDCGDWDYDYVVVKRECLDEQ